MSIGFYDVVDHSILRFRQLLFWDETRLNYATARRYADAVERKGEVNGIWGFINWTLRAICIPDKHQELYYSGYKKCHGVKYQAVLTPDGLVSHLTGPYTGKESDWIAYKNSGIVTWLRELHEPQPDANQLYIYGDPAYSLSYGVLSSYTALPHRPLNPLLAEVNAHMSSLRISVEHGFGKLMMLWGFNSYKMGLKIGLSPVAAYFMVSILLCNIHSCFNSNQTSEKFRCQPPTVHENLVSIVRA